jgi:hypothetical protein
MSVTSNKLIQREYIRLSIEVLMNFLAKLLLKRLEHLMLLHLIFWSVKSQRAVVLCLLTY